MVTIGPYKLNKKLGLGTFAKVKLAHHQVLGDSVAIKIINRRKMESMGMHDKLRREINVLQFMKHPHVIRLYELVDTPSDIFMVLEYVPGGELFDYIVQKSKLPEQEARLIFQQIVSGVEYCHKNMVTHRDLKPENLLLAIPEDTEVDVRRLNIKIADFGLSNIMRDGEFLKTSCGSPNYASPEVVSGKAYVGPEVDVWSCGVVLYALVCGHLPFDDEHIPNLFKKIKHGNFTLPGHLSIDSKDLIVQMLLVDPTRRMTIAQIRRHKFFQKDLPAYLSGEHQKSSLEKCSLNPDIVADLEEIGYKIKDVQNLTPDELVAYHLLSDRVSKKKSYSGLLSVESETGVNVFYGDTIDSNEAEDLCSLAKAFDREDCVPSHMMTDSVPPDGVSERSVIVPVSGHALDCPWQLSLEVVMEMSHLVREVLMTLKDLGYEWLSLTSFRFKVQQVRQEMQQKVTLTIQIYKTVSNSTRYLVDVLLSSGPSVPGLHAALCFLRRLAENEAVAPRIVSKGTLADQGQPAHFLGSK